MKKTGLVAVIGALAIGLLSACSQQNSGGPVRIGINPWPGYEFLYLAAEKGFFAAEGLEVELLELASLADVKRTFEQGRADGMASTVIEAVQVASVSSKPIAVVLVPDFSNGGDIIVAREPVTTMADLKGKKVGVELGLLGTFILSRAAEKAGLSLDDVVELNVEQLSAQAALASGQVDAMVTYPPHSTEILKQPGMRQIFSTSDIPREVIDTVSVRLDALEDPQQWQAKFHLAWQRALDFTQENPAEAYRIMAEREGISEAEFEDALTGMTIVDMKGQASILGSDALRSNLESVCETLKRAGDGTMDCQDIHRKLKSSL